MMVWDANFIYPKYPDIKLRDWAAAISSKSISIDGIDTIRKIFISCRSVILFNASCVNGFWGVSSLMKIVKTIVEMQRKICDIRAEQAYPRRLSLDTKKRLAMIWITIARAWKIIGAVGRLTAIRNLRCTSKNPDKSNVTAIIWVYSSASSDSTLYCLISKRILSVKRRIASIGG